MRIADIRRRIGEIEAGLRARRRPTGASGWTAGRTSGRRPPRPNGPWSRPRSRTSPPAARSTCSQPDGSFLAAGYAPTKHTGKFTVEGRPAEDHRLPARAAERRQPARLRPGPVVQGDVRPDRVRGRGRAGRRARQAATVKFAEGLGRLRAARGARWSRTSTTSRARSGSSARSRFAIDGKDETAWGIDAGPGRRNVEREAVFVAETPVENRRAAPS